MDKELKSRLISALHNKEVYKKALKKLLYSEEKFSVNWEAVKGHHTGEYLTFGEEEVKKVLYKLEFNSLINRLADFIK